MHHPRRLARHLSSMDGPVPRVAWRGAAAVHACTDDATRAVPMMYSLRIGFRSRLGYDYTYQGVIN